MVIASGSVMKKPKVVEESDHSGSEDVDPQSEEEEEDMEPEEDVEIKEEMEDDYLGDSSFEGHSFLAYAGDEDTEIKEEEDDDQDVEVKEEEEEGESELSNSEMTVKERSKKRTKKMTFSEPESDNGDLDNVDSFSEGESENEEDNFGDDESENEDSSDDGSKGASSGLANVMAKILGTKKTENVILSKAKTDKEVEKSKKNKKEETFEIVDSSGKVTKEPMIEKVKVEDEEDKKPFSSQHDREIYRKLWEQKFHKKPSILHDKDKERRLRVLATQGVVQLFSAIEKHKSMMQTKLSECRSVMGREKILENTGKEAFMDILKQQGKKVKKETEPRLKKMKKEETEDSVKEEIKDEPIDLEAPAKKKPKWNVLSDNFYKEPTLHGWDQQSDDPDD